MTRNWTPFTVDAPKKKFKVTVKPLKLEGLSEETIENGKNKIVVIETKCNGPNQKPTDHLLPLFFPKRRVKYLSTEKPLRKGAKPIEWTDDEFSFSLNTQNDSFQSWDVTFTVLYGQSGDNKSKLVNLGEAWLNLGEMAEEEEDHSVKKLPMTLHIANFSIEVNMIVSVSFIENIRSTNESFKLVRNSGELNKEDGFFRWKTIKTIWTKKKKKNIQGVGVSTADSDESVVFDSVGSLENRSSSMARLELDSVPMFGLWKRKRSSFRSEKKTEPLTLNTSQTSNEAVNFHHRPSIDFVGSTLTQNVDATKLPKSNNPDEISTKTVWELKELISRDGQAKLKANVSFASFDQRSEKAAGASACAAIVAIIAHWLLSNKGVVPTVFEFESLITEGSSEWRNLCQNQAYSNCFADKHFDLETVIKADVRPIISECFIGFFSPEKFASLKEAMSFDEIWEEISCKKNDSETKIYIIGWNDHFFVLEIEEDAYYIIDSLGERLSEGCNQAYILKFDDSALMHKIRTAEEASNDQKEENAEKKISAGKDCCKEFIKRFLAAIPLEELEEEEKKGTVSGISLHQRLQIDFHYISLSPVFSSTSSFLLT